MTKTLGAAASAGLVLALVAAALSYVGSETSASPAPSADFEIVVASLSYEKLDGTPTIEIAKDQDFRVRVDFMFNNNGPDSAKGDITVALTSVDVAVVLTASNGCENVQPSDGVDWFTTPDAVPNGGFINGFSKLKVNCTSVGLKQFGATVWVSPLAPATDPNEEDNTLDATGPAINVTGDPCPQSVVPLGDGSPCPATSTPTPSPTPTPTPTLTPTPTPTPTPGQAPSPAPTPADFDNFPWGDMDCDGAVDLVDPLLGLRHVGKLPVFQLPPCPKIGTLLVGDPPFLFGDINCDKKVDALDSLFSIHYIAELPLSPFAPCPSIGK